MRFRYTFFMLIFSGIPLFTHADFIVPPLKGNAFDNPQNLIFSAQTTDSATPLLDHGTVPLPVGVPLSISYHVDHAALWPNRALSGAENDTPFTQILQTNKLYLELWEGTPFTTGASMLQTWDITNYPNGQVSATFPETGDYFLIAYIPDGYYQDPRSACPNDTDWQTDCAPTYTLDQMRQYFSLVPGSAAEASFSDFPDAFGGSEFMVTALPNTATASNVLFLPGIEGSRLYMRNALGIEEGLWEPSIINNISNLALNPDGSSQHEIYTRDLVNYIYGNKALGDVYGPFEDFMDGLVANGTISKWEAYPYDWRYDVRDIVANGTLVGSSTGPLSRVYLQDVLQELASTSPTGKVTIVAHSNGGLLAKALAIELQNENKLNLVDRIIFVGSPQFGTPLSIGSMLNGDGQTDVTGGLITYGGEVRTVAETMPSMYGLLPSAEYFAHVADAPVLFTGNAVNNFYTKYFGTQIASQPMLEDFLSDVPGLDVNFPAADLRTPIALSEELLEKESETHAALDAWVPPAGLQVSTISGWGNLTPYQYTYSSSNGKYINCFRSNLFTESCAYSYRAQHVVRNTDDGDNTVVSPSAIGDASQLQSQSFYFNAKTFSADKLGTIGHGDLTSAAPVELVIKNLLANKNISIPYISTSTPLDELNPLTVVSVHSPMNIVATDAGGNQTGIFPVPGKPDIYFQKQEIPGSSVQILDDEKYLYLPQDNSYDISLQGYDAGLTTLDIGVMDASGNSSTTEEFSNIPTTASTTTEFSIGSSTDPSSTFPTVIGVDIFGDGSTTTIEANQNELSSNTIELILKNEFSKLSVRRGVKNRFLSELSKIENSNNVSYLEKLIQSQIGINLTNAQGIFFLQLLDELQTDTMLTQT